MYVKWTLNVILTVVDNNTGYTMQSTKIHRPPGDALFAYIMVCSLVERNISCKISRQDHMTQPNQITIIITSSKKTCS